jgi:hypothetical protein
MDLINQFMPIIVTVIVLALAWVALRFVFKLASRIFSIGCTVIILIGIVLLLLRIF